MRLNWRDAWFWRGGLADHEIAYTPVLADATDGPIDAPALEHWPVLVSPAEAAWAVHRRDRSLGMRELEGPAVAHLVLVERAGGYHAVVPADCPSVRERFAGIRRGAEDAPGLDASIAMLAEAGVVAVGREGISLLRPPATPAADLGRMRDALDTHDLHVADDLVHRAVRAAWHEQAAGLRHTRYRELASFGRLSATVSLETEPADDPCGVLEVGRTTLPPVRGGDMLEREHLHPGRSLIAVRHIAFDRSDADGTPLLTAAYEVAALLLHGSGTTAMRRVARATALWLVLADESGGVVAPVDRSLRSLARDLATICGLAETTDFRGQTRALLGDLERAGAVERLDDGRVRVLRPPGPSDEAVRHALTEIAAWRATADDPLHDARLPTAHLHRHVRDVWVRLLEEDRLRLTVQAAPVAAIDALSRRVAG